MPKSCLLKNSRVAIQHSAGEDKEVVPFPNDV